MKRPNQNWSKRLRRVAVSPDWRAGYLAGRAGQPPVVPLKIADADAWRDGYAIGLRRGSRMEFRPSEGGRDMPANPEQVEALLNKAQSLLDGLRATWGRRDVQD